METLRQHIQKKIAGFRLVFGYFGLFLMLIGFITAVPLIVLAFYPEEVAALPYFGFVGLGDIVLGLVLYFVLAHGKNKSRFVRHEESSLLMLTWLGAIISGALPFCIATWQGNLNMGITKSIFEVTSGFSTTGLTVFRDFIDVEGAFCPHIFTFHRAWTNFIGGVGLVLLVASVLGAGGGGMSLYVSEGHSDRLLPNIAKSAKLIFGIYLFYTVICTLALLFAGMPLFDSVCHAMSALSGGGFSPRVNNIASFRMLDGQLLPGGFMPVNSLAIEIIIMVFVCFSAISFMLHTFLLRGKLRDFFHDDEIRYAITAAFIALVICFFAALLCVNGASTNYFNSWQEILRMDFFYVIGSMTNSGFASTTPSFQFNFVEGGSATYLGHAFTLVLIFLMLVGGGAGSAAGGIKQYRIAIAVRSLYYSVRYRFSSIHQHYPKLTDRYGKMQELEVDTITEAHHYIFIFVGLFLALSISLCFIDPTHYQVESAVFDVSSAISNTGLSMVIGPDYVEAGTKASYAVMWLLSIGMLLGRLEIFPAAYAISNIGEEIHYHHTLRRRRRQDAAAASMEE